MNWPGPIPIPFTDRTEHLAIPVQLQRTGPSCPLAIHGFAVRVKIGGRKRGFSFASSLRKFAVAAIDDGLRLLARGRPIQNINRLRGQWPAHGNRGSNFSLSDTIAVPLID